LAPSTVTEESQTSVENVSESYRTFRDEFADNVAGGEATLPFDWDAIKSRWQSRGLQRVAEAEKSLPLFNNDELEGAAVTEDAQVAEETLTRMVSQDDFAEMEVLGQFNLGFIVARRRARGKDNDHDDLFIVDQHASDEVSLKLSTVSCLPSSG
jgi:DNA mismatch repair protein PMS2